MYSRNNNLKVWFGLHVVIALLALLITTGILSISADAATPLQWPVPGHTALSRGYSSGHGGLDICDGNIAGANIYAAWGGKVTTIYKCGKQHHGSEADCHGFGTGLAIQGSDGRTYQYAHMQAGSIPANVYYGATVSKGQLIGKVGTTGNSSGPHLHFGISNGTKYWENLVNPSSFSYTYTVPGAHTHSYTSSITKQPTCSSAGTKTFKCSCGNSYTESIAATGHKYNKTVVNPTTSAKGYTKYTCSSCGYSYNDNYVDPIKVVDGWTVNSVLPSGVTTDKYEIQYNNYYEKNQTSSPGSGWTNAGAVKTEWKNSGAAYYSATDLATSDSRVLVSSVYYHFCGPTTGTEGNYEQTSKFVHYDGIDAKKVTAKYLGTDNGHPYYFVYLNGQQLSCHSGTTCDGSYGTHGNRCKAWYKQNTYQNRTKVTTYKFTKESGWTNKKDSAATKLTYRYKIKEAPHKHVYTSSVTRQPDYDVAGVRTYKCSCGDSYTESISALDRPNPAEQNTDEKEVNNGGATDTKESITSEVSEDTKGINEEKEVPSKELNKEEKTANKKPAKDKSSIAANKPGNVKINKVKGAKKKITVYWTRVSKNVKTYQVEVTNTKTKKKTMSSFKQSGKRNMSGTVKKLKKGTYTVRIRAVNRYKAKNLYGKWSAVKRVKVR